MSWQKKLAILFGNHLPFQLNDLPPTACLVGGAVRDALLDRTRDYLDLDFVLPEMAVEVARKIANLYQAGFVVLDEKRQIARVVFEQGTVDFARQEGDSLERDLQRRDFTVNAIAYNPHRQELIDPLNGLADLEKKTLRMVSLANLKDDPLRLFRAYRQAAQLDFAIEPNTREAIRHIAPNLSKIAAERVQNEIGYLLSSPKGNFWLTAAWEDGLLKSWLKGATAEKLQQIERVEQSAQILPEIVEHPFSIAPKVIHSAKLGSLVSSVPEEAELELVNLKYPRAEIRTIVTALKFLPQLQQSGAFMEPREQYFFFLGVGDVFMTLALLAMATGVDRRAIAMLTDRYLDKCDRIAHPKPLVTGYDLIKHLGIAPSPIIGKLLTELQIAHIENKIFTAKEAIEYARQLVIGN
jgi:tRNA nucleotidyltransferase (CCA-adding enzyme)